VAKVPNGVETLRKISIAWVGRTNATDDRQTDGQTDVRRSRSLKTQLRHSYSYGCRAINLEIFTYLILLLTRKGDSRYALQIEADRCRVSPFWLQLRLSTRPIIHQPTNSTIPQLPDPRCTKIRYRHVSHIERYAAEILRCKYILFELRLPT